MSRSYLYKLFILLIIFGSMFGAFFAMAQDGSSGTSDDPLTIEEPATTTTPELATTPEPVTTLPPSTVVLEPRTTTPALPTSLSSSLTPVVPVPTSTSETTPITPVESPTNRNYEFIIIAGVAVCLGVAVFFGLNSRKKKRQEEQEKNSKCSNIKKLLDDKLEELTDLKSRLVGRAKDEAREGLREMVSGTPAGEVVALVEKAEGEYKRIKKLYDECTIKFESKSNDNVIIIHGCPRSEKELIDVNNPGFYYKHWIPYVKKNLTLKGIKIETPLMPEPWAPDYEAFKKEFEKYPVSENTILVGHSCGCAFLVRWLGESKRRIKKLILVAPWKIPSKNNPVKERFYNYSIDETIKSRVEEIIMFTSDNEEKRGKESIRIYQKSLGGKIIELKGRGHYIIEHMGTGEFPELLREIV